MDRALVLFALGASSSLFWPWLPAGGWAAGLLLLALVCVWQRCYWPLALLAGIGWCLLQLPLRLAWLDKLDPAPKAAAIITASLRSAEPSDEKFTRLTLKLERLNGTKVFPAPIIRLNAYQTLPPLTVGSRLTLSASLKPAHGLANAAGMDGRRLLLGRGITATGTLRRLLSVEPAPLGWRARWLAAAQNLWAPLPSAPLLAALTFGEQGGISDEQWQLFRGAGITHIIAISGQHIALVAVLGAWLGRLAGVRGAVIMALVFAATYSWLAGFAVATVRALIMVAVWSVLRWWQREWPSYRLWLCAFVLLVLIDPWALYSAGFWLSFLAVALLLGLSAWQRYVSLWRLQWVLLLGLLPLQLALFAGIAPLALLLNWLLVPLFCVAIIPLALLGVLLAPLLPALAFYLFYAADGLLGGVLQGLTLLAEALTLWWPLAWWWLPLSSLLLLVWLAYRWSALRPLALPISAALLLGALSPAPPWQVRVLDVGQGLAVLIVANGRALLYDTGDRFPGGFNLAEAAVLPSLHRLGINQLDTLLISHKDKDHAGNRDLLWRSVPIAREISSFAFNARTEPCQRGQTWQWQGLTLQLLWPPAGQSTQTRSNNQSCVLQISDGQRRVLLSADIEREAESALVALNGGELASNVLVSPHHGSRTSSTPAFIDAVAPQEVIHSAGFRNQWDFPRADIVERYWRRGARQWVTGLEGEIVITPSGQGVNVRAERDGGPWWRRGDAWWQARRWP
ncbi:MAG: DNA internalization-related competence protein ComEC/Rec2 [Aeromonas sp.]